MQHSAQSLKPGKIGSVEEAETKLASNYPTLVAILRKQKINFTIRAHYFKGKTKYLVQLLTDEKKMVGELKLTKKGYLVFWGEIVQDKQARKVVKRLTEAADYQQEKQRKSANSFELAKILGVLACLIWVLGIVTGTQLVTYVSYGFFGMTAIASLLAILEAL